MPASDCIARLRLSQFRSYPSLDVRFSGAPVVLYGPNGAGKTNILEAVSLLSPGRGLRGAKISELGYRQSGQESGHRWAVAARLKNSGHKIGTGSIESAPNRRQMRLDGKPASGPDISRILSVNWLTPAHDRLFVGPTAERRKFFDRLCLSHVPDHGRTFLAYEKARAERGRLFVDGIHDTYWLDALEKELATGGARIAKTRHAMLERLNGEIMSRMDGVFPKSTLALDGEAEALYAAGADVDEVTDWIKTELEKDRPLDRKAGRTLRGVHKTDLKVTHLEKNMPAGQCSTGEQKALLIGLVLAHARCRPGAPPILLLDEVAAHLDDHRRTALAGELFDLHTQVFLTGTDARLFEAFVGKAELFKVEDNALHLQDG